MSVRVIRPHSLALSAAIVLALPASAAQAAADLDITAEATRLEGTVVTAAGFEQVVAEAPASITVITREQLQGTAYHGLAEALADIEGIDIDDAVDKTGARGISIRGMPGDYTLVLIDGRRQNVAGNVAPNNFNATQNNFIPPLSAIERVEVIRGPMSTLYGSDAMGGVINIITRKPGTAWGGSATLDATVQGDARYGDTYGGNVYLAGPLRGDVLGLSLHGEAYRRDASEVTYLNDGGDEVTPVMGANPVAYDSHQIAARLSVTPGDDHDLWLEAFSSRQRYDNSRGQLGTLGTGGYAPEQRYLRDQLLLAHTGRYGFGTWESSVLDSRTETIGRLIPPGVAGAGTPRSLWNDNIVVDTKLVAPLGDAHMLSVGGQWWRSEMQDGVALDRFKHRQIALFVEDEWRFAEDFALTLGARHDDHSTFGGHTSPRAYLVWTATDTWTLKAGVGQGYKTPRLDQLADGIVGFGGQGRIPLLGSPHLTPETTTTSELGATYVGGNGVNLHVGLFHNAFKDKIATGEPVYNCTYAPSPNRPGCVDVGSWPAIDTFGQSVNIDEAVTRGAEVSISAPLAEAWTLDANYTFTDSEQKSGANAGDPLGNTPRHMANAKLSWSVSDAVSVYWRTQYRSERFRSDDLARAQLGNYRPYSLHTLGGSWRVNGRLRFNAAVYNVADTDFVDYEAYVSNANTGALSYANHFINVDEGRRFWVSMNWDF